MATTTYIDNQPPTVNAAWLNDVNDFIYNETARDISVITTAYTPQLTGPAHQEGLVFYDDNSKTLSYYNDATDVTVNIAQESLVRVRNNTGSTILNGEVVYISGALGNRPTIAKARADSVSTSAATIGLVTHDIANNVDGYVTVAGVVNGLNTNAFAEGTTLYLSAATAGAVTSTQPAFPNQSIIVGRVTRQHITQGSILVTMFSSSDKLPLTGGTLSGNLAVQGSVDFSTTLSVQGNATLGNAATDLHTVNGGLSITRTSVTSPVATDGNVFSGTYTPTLTNVTNVSSSTANSTQYMRVGNVVTVAGTVTIQATVATTDTQLDMSLPVPTNLVNSFNLGGTGGSVSAGEYGESIGIFGDFTNDRAQLRLRPSVTSANLYGFTFSYLVM